MKSNNIIRWFLIALVCGMMTASTAAAATKLVVNRPFSDYTTAVDSQPIVLELDQYFGFRPLVVVRTTLGEIKLELYSDFAPKTVANFLGYVERGDYENCIVHRALPGFVIQTGGYFLNDQNRIDQVPKQDPVVNEFNVSNTRGTVAMAKIPGEDSNGNAIPGGGPDSATSEWFINLDDNGPGSNGLDNQNGGFTVFARVLENGMEVADKIVSAEHTTIVNLSQAVSAFASTPVLNFQQGQAVTLDDLIYIDEVFEYEFPAEEVAITYSISANSNPALINPVIANGQLTISAVNGRSGMADITVRATSPAGYFAEDTVTITVTNGTDPVVTYFKNSTKLDNGWYNSPWFGRFLADSFPLVWHDGHGWWLCHGEGGDSVWFWTNRSDLGWLWTTPTTYPWLWSTATNNWFYFYPGSGGWYFDQSINQNVWLDPAGEQTTLGNGDPEQPELKIGA